MPELCELTDEEIIKQILKNCENRDAWEELYHRMSGVLLATIHASMKTYRLDELYLDSYDIFHDVLLVLYRRISDGHFEFMGVEAFRRYLQVIARQNLIDLVRARGTFAETFRPSAPFSENAQDEADASISWMRGSSSHTPSVEEELVDKERRELLRQAVSTLSRPQRVVMELTLDGFNTSEIAHVLELTDGNVRVIRHRALQKLKKRLS